MEKVLATIEYQLEKQRTEKKYSQDKVAQFIETRVRELETGNELLHKKNP
jgi:hypothetical protein